MPPALGVPGTVQDIIPGTMNLCAFEPGEKGKNSLMNFFGVLHGAGLPAGPVP
jgi:hypothetical protein